MTSLDFSTSTGPAKVLLVVIDGLGEGPEGPGNAVTQADMSTLKELRQNHPWTLLKASGNAVGLPEGAQGNSEVGHFTIGSGRITFQSFEAINQSIESGEFFKKDCLVDACERVQKANQKGQKQALHLMGLCSDEGVHAHLTHLFALLELAKEKEAFPIYIHAILDGRDVPERSAETYLKAIQEKIKELELDQPVNGQDGPLKASIATMAGRFYTMDRDTNWDRTEAAYNLMVHGQGKAAQNPIEALHDAYNNGAETDYYVPPYVFDQSGMIKPNDSVICFNYRTDRVRQITQAFVDPDFDAFKTTHENVHYVAMGPYTQNAPVAFPTPVIEDNLGKYLAKLDIPQLRVSETEKEAHVTYFFNSQVKDPDPLEDRLTVESPKCDSFAEAPEMSAELLTDELIKCLKTEDDPENPYRLVALNYANPDLVGHSGDLEATIKCCQTIDLCLKKLVPAAQAMGFTIFITADHGNAEDMLYGNGEAKPCHTTNPVIGLLISPHSADITLKPNHGLQDVAPTILDILNLEKPDLMTGESLIQA
jgi:2,3-bisphosphoglycerate-independent phosphoglycerate mutase